MKNKALYTLLLMVPLFSFSQTKEEREKIASFSNKEANTVLGKQLHEEEVARKARLANYLNDNPNASLIVKDDKLGKVEIIDILPGGEFIYAKTYNQGSATTARTSALYNGGSLGINIQGQGMITGVWDGGNVRSSHQEFMVGGVSKVTNMNTGTLSDHATHVSGTIGAQGLNSAARGIAFNTSIKAYNWDNDLSEILNEAATGLLMSNHSYGIGQLSSLWFYGAYDQRAQVLDQITYNNQYYLPVVSAGNDRNSNSAPGSTQIAAKQGYDMIFGHGNAKNVLTVAAINQMDSYAGLSSPVMSQFSSYGPSDDGRVKPEISMKGVNVMSTLFSSDTSYGNMSGTSMASPGITGVVTLLQQYNNQLYGNYLKAATVKGLILHTADDAGFTLGPDARFGWGVVNATTAAQTIRDKSLGTNGSLIEERVLADGSTYSRSFTASGPSQLRVSLSWTDPASPSVNTGVVDPANSYLVNDLDISVTSVATGTVYYPWKLQGMATPNAAATNTSTNNADTFERIDINMPSGEYVLNVTHKGTLAAPQNYSLIITAANLSTLSVRDEVLTQGIKVYPNPTVDELHITGVSNFDMVLLDASGRVIRKEYVSQNKINVQSLVKGTYYLIIRNSEIDSYTVKFIKK